jgi:hypothetical protein
MAKKKSARAAIKPAVRTKPKATTAAGEVKRDLIRRRIRGRICLIPRV